MTNQELYKERTKALKVLGFDNYRSYILSELWGIIRKFKYQRNVYKCESLRCRNIATCIHHLNYSIKTLSGYSTQKLVCLCKECHRLCHYDGVKSIEADSMYYRFCSVVILGGVQYKLISGKSEPRVGRWYKRKVTHSKLVDPNLWAIIKEKLPTHYDEFIAPLVK